MFPTITAQLTGGSGGFGEKQVAEQVAPCPGRCLRDPKDIWIKLFSLWEDKTNEKLH